MFVITKPAANRLDIALSGSLDTETMRRALDELIEKSEDIRHGCMLYTISDFEMPSLGAIGVEFTRLPQLFNLLDKFDKCAVLSDTGWIRKIGEMEGALLPGLDIESFDLDEVEAAEAWLAMNKN